VPSNRNPSTRPVASIARAAQKTRSVIEDFQTKLNEVSQHSGLARLSAAVTAEKGAGSPGTSEAGGTPETEAELERQLAAYFERATPSKGTSTAGHADQNTALEDLRQRVIEAVVERILEDWSNGRAVESSELRKEVLERLIERILQQFGTGPAASADTLPS